MSCMSSSFWKNFAPDDNAKIAWASLGRAGKAFVVLC
jgi:hypothetical protein